MALAARYKLGGNRIYIVNKVTLGVQNKAQLWYAQMIKVNHNTSEKMHAQCSQTFFIVKSQLLNILRMVNYNTNCFDAMFHHSTWCLSSLSGALPWCCVLKQHSVSFMFIQCSDSVLFCHSTYLVGIAVWRTCWVYLILMARSIYPMYTLPHSQGILKETNVKSIFGY
jgi:hypothetical protein